MAGTAVHDFMQPHPLCLLALALASSCGSSPPLAVGTIPAPAVADVEQVSFTLAGGDMVLVSVFGHPELSTPSTGVQVDPDGNISLPLVGALSLLGHSLQEAEREIATQLAAYIKEPNVSVALLQQGSRHVYVLGEVGTAGSFLLNGPMTALQALSFAGGPRLGADREQVALLRRVGREDVQVHIFNAATPGVDGLMPVLPGDLIFVRMSGAGAFREQILPYLTGYSSALRAVAQTALTLDRLND